MTSSDRFDESVLCTELKKRAADFAEALDSLQHRINRMVDERGGTFDEAAIDALLEVHSCLEWLGKMVMRAVLLTNTSLDVAKPRSEEIA